MEGQIRRNEILAHLQVADKPVSASRLAKKYGVSRQIIVGDVALLRAGGADIQATARGYQLAQTLSGFVGKIVCQHDAATTRQELLMIVAGGGEIIDVIVEHPLYGELVGGLHIQTPTEVADFVTAYEKSQASLLSALTEGIHMHTIRCQDQTTFENIKTVLAEAGILYQNN